MIVHLLEVVFFWDEKLAKHEIGFGVVARCYRLVGTPLQFGPPPEVTKHYKRGGVSAKSIVMHYIFCVPSITGSTKRA